MSEQYPWNKKNIPKDILIKLYIDEKKTMEEIGGMFKTSAGVISKRMIAYKIKSRSLSESHMGHIPSNKKEIPKETLIKLYINQRLPMAKISLMFKCSTTIICDRIKLYGIKARSKSDAHKGQHSSPVTQFKRGLVPWNKDKKGVMPIAWNKDTKGVVKVNSGSFKKGTLIELHPRWLDGRTYRKTYCKDCGKLLSSYQSTYCRNCYQLRNRGEMHGSWIDGRSFEPYPPDFNQQLKDRIRVRDNFICQKCGIPELECDRRLDIHHIDYNKKNCRDDNLTALCNSCNVKVNANREYWTNYFQNKLLMG